MPSNQRFNFSAFSAAIAVAASLMAATPAEARRMGGMRAMPTPKPPSALGQKFSAANYGGTRATPHFNTVTNAKPPFSSATRNMRHFNNAANAHPNNMGFAQGQGKMQTHKAGTVVLRYGSPQGRYVTTDLAARPTHVAIKPPAKGQAARPAHYYKLTQDVTAPTGAVARAYDQQGGATQVLLNKPVAQSGMVRTVTPNFRTAAQGSSAWATK